MSLFNENQSNEKIKKLAKYINEAHKIVAITGAGISVSGGGVTYNQLYLSNFSKGITTNSRNDYNSFLPTYLDSMFHYKPSFSHYALSNLEKEGKLIGIITTNVDCMHTIAGSKNVAEIQGSLQVNCCSNCGRHYDNYEIWNKKELPRCEKCNESIIPWPLYSHIGLWEEGVKKAREWIKQADLIIVIGTNGYYGSAYWDYRRNDAIIVQINPKHTGFDGIADLNIKENCDDVFKKLEEEKQENDKSKN